MKDSGIEWIGKIPEGWQIIKSKYFILSNDGGVWGDEPHNDDSDKIVIRSTEQTVDGKWIIEEPAKRDLSGVKYENCRILKDDLLMTKSSGSSLHIGKTTLADNYFEEKECYYSNFIQRIRVKNINPRLMWYIFNSNLAREQFVYLQNSTSGIGNINAENISNIFVAVGSDEEQQKIVSFLDDKIGEIDTIIEKTKASIDEYKKYRKAIVIKAVTKGLHPDVTMKRTDSDWIGEIPAHWDYVRIQRLFETVDERNEDENALLLSLYTALGVKPRNELEEKGNKASTVINYKKVKKDDVIVNKLLAWMGAIGYSDYEGVTSPDYDIYRAREDTSVVRNYYNEYFRNTCFNGDCHKYGHGIMLMRWRTYPEEFLRIKVPNPPLEEQQEIADYLVEKCGEIDSLIAKKETFVEEMETYKKSLIYEYVTGKKEVL